MNKFIFVISVFLLSVFGYVPAKSQTIQKTRVKLEYSKNHDKTQNLIAKITAKKKKNYPLKGVLISFYNINDTAKLLLNTIKTNSEGKAILTLSDKYQIYKDSSGLMSFEVEFEGNDSCKSAKKGLSIKETDLKISFFQKDSLKFIEIQASKLNSINENIPLEKVEILFYVKGTFSLLKIGKKETNSFGKAEIEFPIDIPGDTAGVLTIIAKIEENDNYGTVVARGEINWGRPIPPEVEKKRGLGDTDAPLWMVYTLIILLSAVWFHYFYVVYQIVRIKLEEKNTQIS